MAATPTPSRNPLLRRKDVFHPVELEAQTGQLRRTLGVWQLTAVGIGAIIGAGIFVLTGQAAATDAGPAVAISFVIAGAASGCAALCYAEFAGMIPVAGSAYTYGYAVLGEFAGWIIGWDLLLEYTLVVAVVAIGVAGYATELLPFLPAGLTSAPDAGGVVNLPALLICLGIAFLLSKNIKQSVRAESGLVVVKLAIVLLIVVVGVFFVDTDNLSPFAPFGFDGVLSGASLVFFAVFGYDAMTTAAEEAKDPQRDLPRAVMLSLGVSMVLYVLMSVVLTGMVPYEDLGGDAPVADAFAAVGQSEFAKVIAVGAIVGIASVLFSFMLGAGRVWFAMSRDGLLPRWFAKVDPKHGTPNRPTWIVGIVAALVAGFATIGEVAELVNIGTLFAFVIVCGSVLVLRYRSPELERSFRLPGSPIVPLLGIGFSIWLMTGLPLATFARFGAWLLVGTVVYFAYSMRRSNLAPGRAAPGVEG